MNDPRTITASNLSAARAEVDELRARIAEADETLRAIRSGEIDALIVQGGAGDQVYTLRDADHPYRTLVEQMLEGAAILTADGDILYCNRRFAQIVATPLEEVVGHSIGRFIDDADRPSFAAFVSTGSGTHHARLTAPGKQSPNVYFSLTTTVADDVTRRSLIVADLSELVQAQADRDRAERESHAKDELLAMLAHELRNPIGAIAAAVHILDLIGRKSKQAVLARDVITRQVKALAHIINDLLDAGRLTTGSIALARRPVDLADLVRRDVATLAQGCGQRHLEVHAEQVWIDADQTKIGQVVANLVGNAIKYTADQGRIEIDLRIDGEEALLRVVDDGEGIGAELLPRIFDLFVQGDQGLDRTRGGLGIGLTVVRRLVELHGGTVSAVSEGVGLGSTFTVRLRIIPAPIAVAPLPITSGKPMSWRILVIEDNEDLRNMYRVVLELSGHEVLDTGDALRGLDILNSERLDIALIDIGLPVMDGYELVRRFRAGPAGRAVLLVAVTGYGSPDDRDRSRKAGFDHHFVKPFDPDLLWQLLGGDGATSSLGHVDQIM